MGILGIDPTPRVRFPASLTIEEEADQVFLERQASLSWCVSPAGPALGCAAATEWSRSHGRPIRVPGAAEGNRDALPSSFSSRSAAPTDPADRRSPRGTDPARRDLADQPGAHRTRAHRIPYASAAWRGLPSGRGDPD